MKRLAAEYRVSVRTIERDACFSRAVDVLAGDVAAIKTLILSRGARLKRADVLQIAGRDPEVRKVIRHFLETGVVRQIWRLGSGKRKMVVPRMA